MWLEWKQSRLKVIFFILLLLLIASGSVQINVATTTCKNVETLPQKNHLSCFKSLLVSIYIILWLLHKFSNICKPEEGWYSQPKYCYKKQYTLLWINFAVRSLDVSSLVLYILADLISFLEIQRLQLAGSLRPRFLQLI